MGIGELGGVDGGRHLQRVLYSACGDNLVCLQYSSHRQCAFVICTCCSCHWIKKKMRELVTCDEEKGGKKKKNNCNEG